MSYRGLVVDMSFKEFMEILGIKEEGIELTTIVVDGVGHNISILFEGEHKEMKDPDVARQIRHIDYKAFMERLSRNANN